MTHGDRPDAGQLLGVVKDSYFNEQMTRGLIEEVGNGTYSDHELGYTFIRRSDEVYVIFGINYLMPVREDWVIGVVRGV